MRIAIVEDNDSLARGIAYRLQDHGHAIDIFDNGLEADAFLRDDGNEIIVLDVSLPGLDGLSILRNLRQRGDMRPVLLLTARGETSDVVAGLDAGADDYLVKPFAMEEFEARLRALSRRKAQAVEDAYVCGRLSFNKTQHSATVGGDPLDLPRRELAVLESLITSNSRTVSKERLLEHLYGSGPDVDEGAIEVHVSRLRKRLRAHGVEIQVQRGLGYRLVETLP
jgi:DNA-binding response OmpR family regulator